MNSYTVRKKKKPLPPWMQEYGPYIFVGEVILIYVIPVHVLGWFKEPIIPHPVPHAELAIVMGPIKTWHDGSTTKLKSVEVKVMNRGVVPAEGVVVTGAARGENFQLSGKARLIVGETQGYTASVPDGMTSTDAIEFSLSCGTCAAFAN